MKYNENRAETKNVSMCSNFLVIFQANIQTLQCIPAII